MNITYKILICGTIHSGKTSLIEALKKVCHQKIAFVDGSQNATCEKQIEAEINAHISDPEIVICEGGLPDAIGQLLFHQHTFLPETQHLWSEWSRTYHKVYLLNKDDVPFTGLVKEKEKRDALDASIRVALTEKCHLMYTVLKGTLPERLSLVHREIVSARLLNQYAIL